MKKYALTDETKDISCPDRNVTLHRIRALVDFGKVKAGDIGGWIEKEENLSQNGGAWVQDEAEVYDEAKVSEDAKVYGNAEVYGKARVRGSAQVYGKAQVYGNAQVCSSAQVYDRARVGGNATVYGEARVYDEARVYGEAQVYGKTILDDKAQVYDRANVSGKAYVCGDACIYGNVRVDNFARIGPGAQVSNTRHLLVVGLIGSRSDYTTFYKGWNSRIWVCCGCFNGTSEDFLEQVEKTHGDNRHAQVYRAAVALARLQITDGE